jgi:hypothetical protein
MVFYVGEISDWFTRPGAGSIFNNPDRDRRIYGCRKKWIVIHEWNQTRTIAPEVYADSGEE